MLHNLIKKYRGKETIVMTDEYKKVNDKKKQLLDSQRKGIKGQRVEYLIKETTETEKKPWIPVDFYTGGATRKHPRVPKKK